MVHRFAGDSYPSAGINRIRFIGLKRQSLLSARKLGTPLSERENGRRAAASQGLDHRFEQEAVARQKVILIIRP
jgi:hypothetical protein